MNKGHSRVHYRVAKKKIERNDKKDKSMCSKDKHNKFVCIFFALLCISFIKGIAIGYLICKNEEQ